MTCDTGDLVGRVLAVSGVWEPEVTATFRRLLSVGDICVDVGAHIGYYTLLGSVLVGERGHVYSLEPSPARFGELRANLDRNKAINVTALNVAAGAGEGSATLYEAPRANTSASSLSTGYLDSPAVGRSEDYVATEVVVRAVDSLIPAETFPRIRLIKVDVEGYELEVLRGLQRILSVKAPIAVIVEISPDWATERPGPVIDAMCEKYGLAPWRLRNEYSPDGYFPFRLAPPVRIDSIPSERCDVVLVRGLDPAGAERPHRRDPGR